VSVAAGGLVTLGETLGLLVAEDVGPLPLIRGMRLSMGGAESNVAIGVSRLGVPATWIGRLGRDSVGDLIERHLMAERVHCLVRRDAAPTALMLRERRTATASLVSYYRHGSAGSHLCPEDLPDDVIEQAGVLHLTGITPALGPGPAAAVREAMRRARAAGVPVSVDLNFRSRLWDAATAAPVFRELAAGADMLFAGDDEARIALGIQDPAGATSEELAVALGELGPTEVVVKRGRHGATARIDRRRDRRARRAGGRGGHRRSRRRLRRGLPRLPAHRPRCPRAPVHRGADRSVRGHRPRRLGGLPPTT
jgi:2-dehydro-3-deoxygluconokinase